MAEFSLSSKTDALPKGFVSQTDTGYKPSSFGQNFEDEFRLGAIGSIAERVSRPDFIEDPDFDPYALVNIMGYEAFASEFIDSKSHEQQSYIKSVIDDKQRMRSRLHGTGSWAAGLAAGLVDPVNLAPLPFVKGLGFVRGFTKGGSTVAGLTVLEEGLVQSQGIDTPLLESAAAVGGSYILGGILSGAVGSFGKRIDIERAFNKYDDTQAYYDGQSRFSGDPKPVVGSVHSSSGVRIMAKYSRDEHKIYLDYDLINEGFNRKVWRSPRVEGVDPIPDSAFPTVGAWQRFVEEHEVAHSVNARLKTQSKADYENEMNRIGLEKMRLKHFSFKYYDTPLTIDESKRLPSNAYSMESQPFNALMRYTPWLRMSKIGDDLGGDPFLQGNAFELADPGVLTKGAQHGFAKPSAVANKIEQRYGPLPARTIESIDDLWNQSLGARSQEPSTTAVNWSAKRRAIIDTVSFNRGPQTRDAFYNDAAHLQIYGGDVRAFEANRGYPPSSYLIEAQDLLNTTFFKQYADDGVEAGVFGMTPSQATARSAVLDDRIGRLEKRIDDMLNRFDESTGKIADLERSSREQFKAGLSTKQYDLYLNLKKEISADSAAQRILQRSLKDLDRLRSERIHMDQYGQKSLLPANETHYYPRFFSLSKLDSYRDEFKAILRKHFEENPEATVWQDGAGWVRVSTSPLTIEARVDATFARIRNEAREITGDGLSQTERLGGGLRYMQHRSLDLPNQKLVDVLVGDGTKVDFIETDLDMVIRHYSRKMSPQIVIAERFGDRLMEGRRSEIRDYFNDTYVSPLIDKLKAATSDKQRKSILKEISERENQLIDYLDNHRDLRDRLLNQFDINDPSAISTRIVEGVKNWTSLAYSGAFLMSSLPDLARPMMTHGFKNFMDVVGSKYTDMSAWQYASKDMQEVSGIFLDFMNSSGVRRTMDQGDMEGFGKRTGLERFLAGAQGPAYLANILTPWTYKMKQWQGLLAQHLIGKYSTDLVGGTITAKGRQMLAMFGIDDRAAAKIASMPMQRSGKAYMLNTTAWPDEELRSLVGGAIAREVERAMVLPSGVDKPNIMSGVFRVRDPKAKAALDSALGKLLGFSVVGDRAQNPFFSMPFQFLAWPIAATHKVAAEALQRRDGAAFYGAMGMIGMGWLSAWTKDPQWLDREPGQQAIRAVELSGVLGMITDFPLMVEEMSRGEYGLRAMMGYDPLFDRDEGDVIGRVGGAGVSLTYDVYNAFTDSNLTAQERGAIVRRSFPGAGLFYIRDVSKWGQKNFINPLFE